jgi:O-acetyl-ADP-ribose deacetylase (regulator of RNase III)
MHDLTSGIEWCMDLNERGTPRLEGLRVWLIDQDKDVAAAYSRVADELGDWVSAAQASITDIEVDAVISPANSFAFLDGGLDLVYRGRFGYGLQNAARRAVLYRHHGELIVGVAEIVSTGDERIPYLVLAPTMRVPMVLPSNTINPYLACRAALVAVEHGSIADGPHAGTPAREHIRSIAIPGLGTGVGRVPADTCARQVRTALAGACGMIGLPRSWSDASMHHQLLYTDGPVRLQP